MKQGAFNLVARDGLEWLECGALARFPWLLHAFSTRRGGGSEAPAAGLNLGFIAADTRASVEKNRRRFFAQLGAERFALAALRQRHSTHIYQVVRAASGQLEYCPSAFPAPDRPDHLLPIGDARFSCRFAAASSQRERSRPGLRSQSDEMRGADPSLSLPLSLDLSPRRRTDDHPGAPDRGAGVLALSPRLPRPGAMQRLALPQDPGRFRPRYFSGAWSGADDPCKAAPPVPLPPQGSDCGPRLLADPFSPLTEHRATNGSGSLHRIPIP